MDKINSTCRVCLTEDKSGTSVFESQDSMKYSELIKEYTRIEIIQHENLPSIICDDCTAELMVVIQFNDKCRLSNDKLQEILDLNSTLFKTESSNDDVKEDLPIRFLIKDDQIKSELEDFDTYDDHLDYDEDLKDVVLLKKEYSRSKKSKLLKSKFKKVSAKKGKYKVFKEKEVFKCEECDLSIPSRSALLIHNRKHTGERPYQCPTCQKCFALRGTLKEHISRLHTENRHERQYVCDVCGKPSVKKADLVVHMRIHTKEKPYKCPHCPQSFAQTGTLASHVRVHTGEKPFACHACGKRFIAHSALSRHMIVHSDEKKFRCHICDKPLKSSYALKQHVVFMHTSEKPHICDKCGAAFNCLPNLRSHMKAKHSERSGYCEQCKRPFPNLFEHMRTHNGDKPFECDICKKKFAIQRSLTAHLIKHRNSNKFACPHDSCTIAFSQQFRLDYHILKIHNKRHTHVCEICSRGFFRSSDLVKHRKANCCKRYKKEIASIDLNLE